MFYVYILQNQHGKIYKGFTNNVKRRLDEHNRGEVKFTSSHRPWSLIHYAAFSNKKLAVDYEKYLKSGSGREFSKRHLYIS